jgi:hypothetical protein
MEARLGADFSAVRLHTGPAAQRSAAELGARAYTAGGDIVLGSGPIDQHTLAHELVHVIQQRGGPVAGTERGDGLRVSDPADPFERAAESAATQALRGDPRAPRAERREAGPETLQRLALWHRPSKESERKSTDVPVRFAVALDGLVVAARNEVLARPDNLSNPRPSGYIDLWYRRFWDHVAEVQGSEAFLYTAFGYAVEVLVTQQVDDGKLAATLPPGWRVAVQESRGHTRPDFVLYNPDGADVGWFDVTAEKSKGHIKKTKTGSQWSTKPYVAELLYDSLNIGDLAPSDAGPAMAAKRRARATEERRKRANVIDATHTFLAQVYADMSDPASGVKGDAAKKRRFVRDRLQARVGPDVPVDSDTTRSLLSTLDVQSAKPGDTDETWMHAFGFVRLFSSGRSPGGANAVTAALLSDQGAAAPAAGSQAPAAGSQSAPPEVPAAAAGGSRPGATGSDE